MICVPGVPVRLGNPCIDPLQSPISHIVESYKVTGSNEIVFDGFKPNTKDYPEYEFIIKMFIDKYNVNLFKWKEL